MEQFIRRRLWERLSDTTRDQLKYDVVARVIGQIKPGTPQMEFFGSFAGDEKGRRVFEELSRINTYRRTHLCNLMRSLGSDKGLARHNYTTAYARLFDGLQSQPLRIFELGIGTDDPDLPSSMGSAGSPGASLRGWSRFFPAAQIYAADIDRNILFREDRIATFYCDQTDPDSVRELWNAPDLRAEFDILIEDGLHTFEANLTFLEGSLGKVKRGGYYVVEDVANGDLPRWRELLRRSDTAYPEFTFCIVTLPWFNTSDNTLIVGKRAP
jgi:hypothetical protein